MKSATASDNTKPPPIVWQCAACANVSGNFGHRWTCAGCGADRPVLAKKAGKNAA